MKKFRLGPLFTPPSLAARCSGRRRAAAPTGAGRRSIRRRRYLFVRARRERHGQPASARTTDPIRWSTSTYSNQFARGGEGASTACAACRSRVRRTRCLTAIDLNKGEIAWQVPLGEGSPALRNHPLLKGVTLPDRLGSRQQGRRDGDQERSGVHRRRRRVLLRLRQEDRPRGVARRRCRTRTPRRR